MSAFLWVGTHHPYWLAREAMLLMVSRRALADRRTLPRRLTDEDGEPYPWVLDCGGFTELSLFGGWTVTPRQYVAEARRFSEEIGPMAWAAIQDWMCEPFMLAKTGLDVQQHQARTVASYLELTSLAPDGVNVYDVRGGDTVIVACRERAAWVQGDTGFCARCMGRLLDLGEALL